MYSNISDLIQVVNQTQRVFPQDKAIHQLFEEQVTKTPDNIAVVFEDKQLTYKELNQISNQLARCIKDKYKSITNKDLQPDTLIALYLDRSLEMIISILAVLKTGAAYVPISPEFPIDRTKYILDDTNASILLSQVHLTDKLNQVTQNIEIIATDDSQEFQNYDKHNLSNNLKPNNLAYVIYTSGTTGKPKGVMIEHISVINTVSNIFDIYDSNESKINIGFYASYIFDVSVSEIFSTILYGNILHIYNESTRLDSNILSNYLIDNSIDYTFLPPIVLSTLTIEKVYPSLKGIIVAGEPCNLKTALFWKDKVNLYNYYGPTETAIYAAGKRIDETKVNNIGKPISNTQLYILDNNLLPSPIGVPGELYIGGVGLARGYLNLPELTKERFINNPFASQDDIDKGCTRLYKTGDICKWLANGEIEYVGRNDFQVKLRGFRIELGEIENVLSAIDNIKQSCVLVSNETLVAYYVADTEIDESVIKNHLAKKLPEYMIPSFYMKLESFPLTINGKLDRRALPDFDISNIKQQYLAPSTDLQQKMCQIWKEVLNIDKVGITDNFFNIGGNSILAITTIMRINKLTNKFYQVIDLFKSQTIQQLSNLEVNSNNISNERLNLTSEKLHHFEKVIFNHQLSSGENLIYNESFLIDYKKHIDLNNLKSGVKYLLDKYTLLHSNYVYNNDGCLKRILNYDSFCICEQKIVETQTELHQVLNEIERISFDLYTDKLIRFYLIDVLDTKKQYLFISCHHLILDATSLSNIILPDLYLYLFLNEKDNTKSDINNFNEASYYINKHYKNNFEEKLSFWKNKLEYLSPIDLSKNNQEFTNKGKQISFNCDKKTRTQLLKVSRNLNISKFSILYTLFTLVLYKISNQNKFAIITNVDERLYTPKHKDTIGCLINNMFLVSDFANNNDLSYFIYQAGSEIISNINNAIAYESLLDNLHREHIRLLSDIQFNFETEEIHSLPYNQTQIYSHSGYVKQGLYFEVDLKNDEILCRVEFNNQYEKDFIYTLINGYKNLLSRLDIILDKKISEISIIDDDQYKQILTNSIGKYRGYPQDKAIHQLFEEQVTKTPNNIAVVFEDKQLTYKELNQISNQLARYIKDKYKSITNKDLQPDTLIALYLDRSLEMIISILA
ncbi:non-ribosomal peptide synthetase, partial [Francisella tularensis]